MKIISKTDFTSSLNLPRPTVTVASDLVKREKFFLEKIQDPRRYKEIIDRNKKGEGIHYHLMEHPINIVDKLDSSSVFNQIFKDIFIRHETMSGNIVNHELLFTSKKKAQDSTQKEEIKIEAKKTKVKKGIKQSKNSIELMRLREENQKKLEENVNKQIIEINNLGTLLNYTKNSLTESSTSLYDSTLDTFLELYEEKKIRHETRPVHWCTKCKDTIVKEDIFYEEACLKNHYILYRVDPEDSVFAEYKHKENIFFLVDTIQPWAILPSEYVALAKNVEYSVIEIKDRSHTKYFVMATNCVDKLMQLGFIVKYKEKDTFKAEELKNVKLQNPLDLEKKVEVVVASSDKIMIDATSCGIRVVSAGNTYVDYLILKETKRQDKIRNITDTKGKLNMIFKEFGGKKYLEANALMIQALQAKDLYYEAQETKVKIPKCHECSEPLIYREMGKWYIQKEPNEETVKKELQQVIPKLVASNRFKNKEIEQEIRNINHIKEIMISDDRVIGTPIPTFYCASCGKEILSEKTITLIKKLISEKGIEEWHKLTPEEILQGQVSCECGGVFFFKDDSFINDVFTSFSSSLQVYSKEDTVSVFCIDSKKQFYQKLLAYSFSSKRNQYINQVEKFMVHAEVDENSTVADINLDEKKEENSKVKQQMKQIGIIDAVRKYGTDVLRLWIAKSAIDNTVQLNGSTIAYIRKKYLDIRRTFKFLLSNLYDFDPIRDKVPLMERNDLDKIVYRKITILNRRVNKAYKELRFHDVFQDLQTFCEDLLCKRFFESSKYNLYILKASSKERRSVQSTMYDALMTLVVLYAPILPFTLEEIWGYIHHTSVKEESNMLMYRLPLTKLEEKFEDEETCWHTIFYIRDKIIKHLNRAQQAKVIKNSLEAKVVVNTQEKQKVFMEQNRQALKHALNISELEINLAEGKGSIKAVKATGIACARCKNYSVNIGMDLKYRYLCPDCAKIMHQIE